MWVIVKRVWFVFAAVGGTTLWLSTNSIPKAVKDADGFWATNLKHIGWDNPPGTLASNAADNIGVIVGILLIVFSAVCLCAWLLDKFMKKPRGFDGAGIRVTPAPGSNATLRVIGGTFLKNGGSGIWAANGVNLDVEDCHFEENGQDGITLDDSDNDNKGR